MTVVDVYCMLTLCRPAERISFVIVTNVADKRRWFIEQSRSRGERLAEGNSSLHESLTAECRA